MKRILHVGCGKTPLPDWLEGIETRQDIDPAVRPDILCNMMFMGAKIGKIGPFDVVYCSHALEHLYPHQAIRALVEFWYALESGGVCIIIVPDLEDIQPTEETLYITDSGTPITGHDLFYGHRESVMYRPNMAHHSGFTSSKLEKVMQDAGFKPVQITRGTGYNLIGVGVKP